MGIEGIRELVARLSAPGNALIAVGIALQAQAAEIPRDSSLQSRVDEVLKALGALEAIRGLGPAEVAPVLAGIRADLLLGAKLISRGSSAPGWSHAEGELLQSFGDVSAGFPRLLKTKIAPQLDGLLDRLDGPDASFLDVGVGVAALSIEMVRQWPSLRVIGIDPWSPSLAIARQNVRSAGLTAQIELHEKAGEDLAYTDAFDLGWVPSAFIPERSIPKIVERVSRALRPGGWLLLAMVNPGADPLVAATARFRTTLWGGSLLTTDAVKTLLRGSGLVEARMLAGPPGSPIAMAAARRAQS